MLPDGELQCNKSDYYNSFNQNQLLGVLPMHQVRADVGIDTFTCTNQAVCVLCNSTYVHMCSEFSLICNRFICQTLLSAIDFVWELIKKLHIDLDNLPNSIINPPSFSKQIVVD